MTMYNVAFNRETKVATIMDRSGEVPEGSDIVGQFNATAVSPAPTDASHQHIITMLQRNGIDNVSDIKITRQSIEEVAELKQKTNDLVPPEDNMKPIAEAATPLTAELAVDEELALVEGPTKGMTFVSSDENVLKTDDKSGKAVGVSAGTATVTLTDKTGKTNQVVVTVHEAISPDTASNETNQKKAEEAPNAKKGQ